MKHFRIKYFLLQTDVAKSLLAGERVTSVYGDVLSSKLCFTSQAAALFLFYCTF